MKRVNNRRWSVTAVMLVIAFTMSSEAGPVCSTFNPGTLNNIDSGSVLAPSIDPLGNDGSTALAYIGPCLADLNGDDSVGVIDLLFLLGAWGEPSAADFDGGGVGVTDLLFLLANWGPCP